MNRNLMIGLFTLMAGSLFAADSEAKGDVLAAAKKLGDKANYSWQTTVVVPEGTRFRPGPTDGKTEKEGLTWVKMAFGNNTTQLIKKGEKAVVSNQDGDWDLLEDLDTSEGRGRFLAAMVRNFKTPAAQAAELVDGAKTLAKTGDTYAGELTEETAKSLIRFRRGGDGPAVSNPKGSIKFWVADGLLSKYEFKVQGKMTINENEVEVDRTTTVEIKDVGTTKLEVPEAAKKKLS